jgi:hypothetical protein
MVLSHKLLYQSYASCHASYKLTPEEELFESLVPERIEREQSSWDIILSEIQNLGIHPYHSFFFVLSSSSITVL